MGDAGQGDGVAAGVLEGVREDSAKPPALPEPLALVAKAVLGGLCPCCA